MVMDNWLLPLSIAVLGDETSVDQHLELGKKFLQEGQLSDALYHYSAAIGMALSLSSNSDRSSPAFSLFLSLNVTC